MSGDARDGDAASGRHGATPRPFTSTGPQGHRGRMRDRLLGNGAAALADYEILEMLLFLGVPRRDTKPLAKATINRFGSLAAVLAAPPRALREVPEIGPDCVVAIRIVQEATLRLAQAEAVEKPLLNNWERLTGYLDAALARDDRPSLRLLFLDNRNRLLADEVQELGLDDAAFPREVVRRALELHATALILVQGRAAGEHEFTDAEVTATARMRKAGAVLSITLHDHLLVGGGEIASLRRHELL